MPLKTDEPIFPIAGWTIEPRAEYGIILFCPSFLTHPSQHPGQANPGRIYALTAAQALDLAQKILELSRYLENAGPQTTPDPRH